MANFNCTVYFRENGTSKIYSLEQARGRVGSYGIGWYEGTRQRQKIIGQYSAAVAAKMLGVAPASGDELDRFGIRRWHQKSLLKLRDPREFDIMLPSLPNSGVSRRCGNVR